MGYENLYGLNKGSAMVWGRNSGLDMLQQSFDKDRQRREKDDAELQAQVAKIDVSKIREPEKEDVYKMYDGVKNLYRQYANTSNKSDRRRLEAEMSTAKTELQTLVGLSQETATRELELYKLRLGKNKLNKEYAPNYMALTNTKVTDPNYKTLAEKATTNIYAPEFDREKYFKRIESTALEQIDDPKIYTRKVNGGTQTYKLEGNKVNPEKLATQIRGDLVRDEGLRDEVLESFPNMPIEQATNAYIKYTQDLLESKNKVKETGLSGFTKDDNWREKMYLRALLNKDNDGAESTQSAPIPMLIPFNKGESKVNTNDYRGISISKKNFVGSEYIDLKTGKPGGKLESSSDYEIVGVGNFPVMKGRKDATLNGAIAQPKFEKERPDAIEYSPMVHVQLSASDGGVTRKKDVLVPYDKLPLNVKNSKAVKEALSGFQPAKNKTENKTNNLESRNKVVPLRQIQDLVGKKGYEGYSEKELIEYYKGQGFTIK